MYKIMLLGDRDSRINQMTQKARELGYFIILCNKSDPSLEKMDDVDKFYSVDVNDIERLLEIAKDEKIDGIMGGADPSMHSVNEIASRLGLMGNSVEGVDNLLSKEGLRKVQKKLGITCPEYHTVNSAEEMTRIAKNMKYPVIVKPNQCSGTSGVVVLDEFDSNDLENAYQKCSNYSRNNLVNIEEYEVNRDISKIIEIDVFVLGKEIIWNGIRYCHRSEERPLIPLYDIYSADDLTDEEIKKMKHDISAIFDECGIVFGELNIEAFFTEGGDFFIIEINPRQAGCYNPRVIYYYCGIDLTKLLVSTCVRDYSYYDELKSFAPYKKYIGNISVPCHASGVFKETYVDPELKPYLIDKVDMIKPGTLVEAEERADGHTGYYFFDFGSKEIQQKYENELHKHVYAIIENID